MKKSSYVFLLLLIAGSLFAQKELTLEEAISIALQRNSNLIVSKNNLESTKAGVKNAYGDLLPNVGTYASWDWNRIDDNGSTQVDYLGNETAVPSSTTFSRSYSVGVNGGVTLFNGMANWANISQSKQDVKAAEYQLEKLKQDIVYQTTEYFYAVVNAKELMKVQEENVKYNQKQLETISERNKLGSIPVADLYAQQVQSGNAELQLIEAENSYETALSELLNYLALDVLEDYTLKSDVDPDVEINTSEYMEGLGDIMEMVGQAMKSRFDYKGQEYTVKSAQSGLTMARGGFFPSLSGDYGYYSSATVPSDLFDRKVLSFGLTLSFPLFSNFDTETQTQAAKVTKLNAEEDLSALERQIKIEVKQGYLDLMAAQKNLEVTYKNVESAGENRKVNTERYNLGAGNIVELLQADRDYVEAMSDNINALYNFFVKRDQLLNALGELDYKVYE